MPVPAAIRPGATEERRIIRATGYRCEICGDEWPARHLEIHFLPRSRAALLRREDLHQWILVLCSCCHRDLHRHRCSLRDQRYLVSLRDPRLTHEIHRILRSPSPPYAAPDTFNPEWFFLDPSPVPWGWVV